MKTYTIIYADPPWRFKVYNRKSGLGKSADRHYKTMTTKQIMAMPVCDMVAKNAFLIMWVYDAKLADPMRIAEAWGFNPEPVTCLFRWLKTTKSGKLCFGQGYHTRGGACEEAWLFKRGRGLPVLSHGVRKEFYAPRREHSRKPHEPRQGIVKLYGRQKRAELFSRVNVRGWDAYGDQVGKFGSAR